MPPSRAIRLAILSYAEDVKLLSSGEIELGEFYFGDRRKGNRGRGAAGKTPVFGILERDGRVHVSVVADARKPSWGLPSIRFAAAVWFTPTRSAAMIVWCSAATGT
jgi:hypothetical protein